MANFCGRCGRPLDKSTGQCPVCSNTAQQSSFPVWWTIAVLVLVVALGILLAKLVVDHVADKPVKEPVTVPVTLSVTDANGENIEEYDLIVESTDEGAPMHLETSGEQIRQQGLQLQPGSYQLVVLPADAPTDQYVYELKVGKREEEVTAAIGQDHLQERPKETPDPLIAYSKALSDYAIVYEGTQSLASGKPFESEGWANRQGLISAALEDMDADGKEELIAISLDGEDCTVDLYTTDDDGNAVDLGSETIPYELMMLDLDAQRFVAYTIDVGGVKSLCIENAGGCLIASGGEQRRYHVFQLVNGSLRLRIMMENECESSSDYCYAKTVYDADGEPTREIMDAMVYDESINGMREEGTYVGEEHWAYFALVDEGFPETKPIPGQDSGFGDGMYKFVDSFFDHPSATKICSVITQEGPSSTVTDYTRLVRG